MIVMSLDLEMNKPVSDIIEIGAVIGCTETNKIIDSFSVLTIPTTPISDYINKLTNISQTDIDNKAVPLREGYDKLVRFHTRYGAHYTIITWGAGDMETLKSQVNPENWPFGRRYVDVKTIYKAFALANGMNAEGGLSKCVHRMGISFTGRKHTATADAENTLKLYFKLLQEMKK